MPCEQPLFFQLGGDRLFGMLHLPEGRPRHGLVICHALAEEKLWSHRVFVTLARELAHRGMAVLRFDFRGEGESDLDFEQAGVATRIDDAVRAAEVLLEQQPALAGISFLGHRLGGAVAAAAAARLRSRAQALLVWDPLPSGHEYLMQLLRSTLAKQMAREGQAPRTRQALIQALQAGETVVVDGYTIGQALYRELIALELPALLEALECPALLIAAADGPPQGSTAPGAQATGRANIQHASAREPAFWRENKELRRCAPNMTAVSVQWLERQLS